MTAGGRMGWIELDGDRIYYEELGEGQPLLFISGWASDATAWRDDMAWFSKQGFRCLTLEHPGLSGQPLPEGPFGTPQMADRIASGLRALGLEQVAALGLSMGGAVAQELALRHPELVEKCVLCGTWAKFDIRAARAVESCLGLMQSCGRAAALRMILWLVFGSVFYEKNLAAVDGLEELGLTAPVSLDVYDYQAQACLAHDTESRLGGVRCPALVLHGDEDLLLRPRHGRMLAERIPDAQYVEFPEAGHCHIWEQPRLFRRSVMEFVRAGV